MLTEYFMPNMFYEYKYNIHHKLRPGARFTARDQDMDE